MPTAKRAVSAVFDELDHTLLLALRRTDPQASLVRRWDKARITSPRLCATRLGFVPLIMQNGWAVIWIEEGFAFTVGLNYHFNQVEFLVVAPHLSSGALQEILNTLGKYVALSCDDRRIAAGERVELAELGVSLTFNPYSEQVFQKYPTGYLATFESVFEDRQHENGDTLPVIWAELAPAETSAMPGHLQ